MDDDSVLIEPRRIPGDPRIDHPIILNLFEPYFDYLRKELRVKKPSLKRTSLPFHDLLLRGRRRKGDIHFRNPPRGTQAAMVLERLIAMGATKILAFGCCGSLQPDVEVGTLVVPTTALSEEGTSLHYPLPRGREASADETIVELCRREAQGKKFKVSAGKVWTTDALFRETRGKTKEYSEKGLLAVEMEMSALFTVAAYRKVQMGGLMVVSDELASLKWRTGFLNPLFWLASRRAARLAVEICRLL